MNDLCIFRCQREGEMFRVLEFSHPLAPSGIYYSVYRGRKLAIPVRFEYLSDAIQKCVKLCCIEEEERERGNIL